MKVNRNSHKVLIMAPIVFISLILLPTITAHATNPQWCYVTVHWKDTGHSPPTGSFNVWYRVYYDKDDTPYCSGCTTSSGNPFDHAHFPHGFNFSGVTNAPDPVTPTLSDAWWNDNYFEGSGYTLIDSSTCSKNCHGHSTDRDYWPDGTDDGVGIILEDDYTSAVVTDADIWATNSHSKKIICICDNGGEFDTVRAITEKNGSSGIYRYDYWNCPIGAGGEYYLDADLYKD